MPVDRTSRAVAGQHLRMRAARLPLAALRMHAGQLPLATLQPSAAGTRNISAGPSALNTSEPQSAA
jgi:hypothetical protein